MSFWALIRFWCNTESMSSPCSAGSIQQKVVVLDNSLQKIVRIINAFVVSPTAFCFYRQQHLTYLFIPLQLKGQDDLKALVESSIKSIADQLSVLNSHSSKLDEISSTLSVWPKQIEIDLRQLQSDIFRIFTKEMEVVLKVSSLLLFIRFQELHFILGSSEDWHVHTNSYPCQLPSLWIT